MERVKISAESMIKGALVALAIIGWVWFFAFLISAACAYEFRCHMTTVYDSRGNYVTCQTCCDYDDMGRPSNCVTNCS